LKMGLILLAGLNMLLFYGFAAAGAWFTGAGELPPLRARIAGALSLLCWLGVIASGRVITAFRPPYFWCPWCG
jgi:hypothetical protein